MGGLEVNEFNFHRLSDVGAIIPVSQTGNSGPER